MKRSIRAVTTGSGTEPSSSTASWNARMLNLKLAHCPTCSSLPSRLYLDHSHCPVLVPATLAALPSTRAIETRSLLSSLAATHRGFAFYVAFPKSSIPDRDVFYVADPISSIETRSLPTLTRSFPRHFTFYVADPFSSHSRRFFSASLVSTVANHYGTNTLIALSKPGYTC
jgi:hypothetical protein